MINVFYLKKNACRLWDKESSIIKKDLKIPLHGNKRILIKTILDQHASDDIINHIYFGVCGSRQKVAHPKVGQEGGREKTPCGENEFKICAKWRWSLAERAMDAWRRWNIGGVCETIRSSGLEFHSDQRLVAKDREVMSVAVGEQAQTWS